MASVRKILNLVDDVSSVNYGIWHAAIATADELNRSFGIESWLVSPRFDASFQSDNFPALKVRQLPSTKDAEARTFFGEFDSRDCVIATHGCWQYASRWGAIARSMGFAWVYTPHGMLEPWSMQQKRWKKLPYFQLIEKPMVRKASLIRAVGKPELDNLQHTFPEAVHIPNGIYRKNLIENQVNRNSRHFLFLARLHHKKNVLPLAEAWVKISPEMRKGSLLRIAGTDDGEQEKLQEFIRRNPDSGIEFLGPVFGEAKENLMADSMFYILPSLSEGFPTSVVEAAGAGLIPLISKGCNFPELLETGGGLDSGTNPFSIQKAMECALRMSESDAKEMRLKAQELIKQKFLWEQIAGQQANLYASLLNSQKV